MKKTELKTVGAVERERERERISLINRLTNTTHLPQTGLFAKEKIFLANNRIRDG